jgi:hypothetical protein
VRGTWRIGERALDAWIKNQRSRPDPTAPAVRWLRARPLRSRPDPTAPAVRWLRARPLRSRPDPTAPAVRWLRDRTRAQVAEDDPLREAEATAKARSPGGLRGRLRARPLRPSGFAGRGHAFLRIAATLTGAAAIGALIGALIGWSANDSVNDFPVPGSGAEDVMVRTDDPTSPRAATDPAKGRTGDHNEPTADAGTSVEPAKSRVKPEGSRDAAAAADATTGFPGTGFGGGAADPSPEDASPGSEGGSGGKPPPPDDSTPTAPPSSSSPPAVESPPASSPSWTETGVEPPDGGGAGGVDSGIGE